MCLSEEMLCIHLFLEIGLLLLSWDYEALQEGTVSYAEIRALFQYQLSTLQQDPKDLRVSFLDLPVTKSAVRWKDVGSRGILKETLLTCLSKEDLHV